MDRRILRAIAEIDAHLDRVEITDLAAAVDLSVSRFAHLFSRDLGITPSRYIHALRMERARTLMARTFLTVKEVMTLVGVTDASHFSRDFRRYHGILPSAVRSAHSGETHSAFFAAHLDFVELARGMVQAPVASANEQ